ncbi:MAG: terpene cyclase/mutase family protein, partial [Propionibacteriaceae bacterium]|nr:terpene cyclase/mutase family protein [Propionibacteriaceae bacterium]
MLKRSARRISSRRPVAATLAALWALTTTRRARAAQAVGNRRWAGALLAALLTATTCIATPVAAQAETPPADRAASYLVSQLVDGDHLEAAFGAESITADGLLALAATGNADFADAIAAMAGYLEKHAADYAGSSPEAAAKLALAAQAARADPTAFGGVDLIAEVEDGVNADGSFGATPMPYSAGLAMVALARAGRAVNPELTSWLVSQASGDGSFSYSKGGAADPDNTAGAVLGLVAASSDATGAGAALDAAKRWAASSQQDDGHWEGMSPVNSTAVLGSALLAAGVPQPEATAWLADQQLPDGSLPAKPGGDGDLFATAQAVLLLAGGDYLTVSAAAGTSPPGATGEAAASAPPPTADEPSATVAPRGCAGVVVVVDPGDLGPLTVGCAQSHATGYDALASAGFEIELTRQGMLCRIDSRPEACVTATDAYWSYWHAKPPGRTTWEYATQGGGTYQPQAGEVEGWRFGDGSQGPSLAPNDAVSQAVGNPSAVPAATSGTGDQTAVVVTAVVVLAAAVG